MTPRARLDDEAAVNPNLVLVAVIAVAGLGALWVVGATVTTLPTIALLAAAGVAALFVLVKYAGLRLTGKGPGRVVLVGVLLVLAFLLIAPTAPAVENVLREPEERYQDVTVKGLLSVDPDPILAEKGAFPSVDVTWRDSRMATFQFTNLCFFETKPVTVNARLRDQSGAQEDYTASVNVGTFCQTPWSPIQEREFTVTIARVVPGDYTVYVSATQPDGSSVRDIGAKTVGDFTIKNRDAT